MSMDLISIAVSSPYDLTGVTKRAFYIFASSMSTLLLVCWLFARSRIVLHRGMVTGTLVAWTFGFPFFYFVSGQKHALRIYLPQNHRSEAQLGSVRSFICVRAPSTHGTRHVPPHAFVLSSICLLREGTAKSGTAVRYAREHENKASFETTDQ